VPITIGRDYGDRVEVLSGLHPSDQIIVNPSDSLIDGTALRLTDSKPAGAAWSGWFSHPSAERGTGAVASDLPTERGLGDMDRGRGTREAAALHYPNEIMGEGV
jgi:hypothetical protein